mgnify:CR=1 FL=1
MTGEPRPGWLDEIRTTGVATYRLAKETNLSFLAAAIAYYGFVSAVPLVVLGVLVATTLGGDELAEAVIAIAGQFLAPAGEDLLRAAVRARTGAGGVTAVGLGVLLWGALKAFRALDRAFSLVYGTTAAHSLPASIRDALVALFAVGLGVVATSLVGTAIAIFDASTGGLLGSVVLVPTLFVVFLPLYYLFPDVDCRLEDVLPGTALVAVGWAALGSLFGVYATTVGSASLYGFLGGVLLVLTWLYLGALLLLVGAATNAVRADREPSDGADR